MAAAAGINRAHIFLLQNVAGEADSLFATSGLTMKRRPYQPKILWYFASTLTTVTGNLEPAGSVPRGCPCGCGVRANGPYMLKFVRPTVLTRGLTGSNDTVAVYALWLSSKTGASVRYNLHISGGLAGGASSVSSQHNCQRGACPGIGWFTASATEWAGPPSQPTSGTWLPGGPCIYRSIVQQQYNLDVYLRRVPERRAVELP